MEREEDSETSDERVPLFVSKWSRVVSGRRSHRLRMLTDDLMCRDGKSQELLLELRAARFLAARLNSQTAFGSRASTHFLWSKTAESMKS